MHTRRRSAPTECVSRGRYRSISRMHRASRRRRRAAATDRGSSPLSHGLVVPGLRDANAIAQIRRELELLRVDRTTQPLFELAEDRGALHRFRHRRLIDAPDMAMIALHAAQQLANARLEVRVAARAAPASRRAEVRHRRVAEAAARAVARTGRRRDLLMHGLQKLAQRMLRRRDGRLDTALRGASLAQMQLMHGVVLDLREMHDGVTLVAIIAEHVIAR